MKIDVIIPARLQSTRLPNKVLLDLGGKPVVQWVYEQAKKAQSISRVWIATDNKEVAEICSQFTDSILMTRSDHASGTDRIAEAAPAIKSEGVINVQGDEPFIQPKLIDQLARALEFDAYPMVTAAGKIQEKQDYENPNVVKVVLNNKFEALYFSRASIPFDREQALFQDHEQSSGNVWRHFGIYGYQVPFLLKFSQWKPSFLERMEKLEQLRALENGYSIKVIEVDNYLPGIDTQQDLDRARKSLQNG